MITLTQAIDEIVEGDGFLNFGISNRLLNLTQTAKWIKPLIETRLKKTVSTSALLMALSRMAKIASHLVPSREKIKLSRLNVYNDLCELAYPKTSASLKHLEKVQALAFKNHGYLTITQGVNEIMIIAESKLEEKVRAIMSSKPIFYEDNLAALGVQFDPKYVWNVGFVYHLVQQVTLQNINILDFSSTYTELFFYLKEKDLRLAFDTIYGQFMR